MLVALCMKGEASCLPAGASRGVAVGVVEEAGPMGLSARRKSINGIISSWPSLLGVQVWVGWLVRT